MTKDKQEPLVSVITITYNSEATIKDTIDSLLNQNYKNIEYIIIDGKSTDNTISIINSYERNIKKSVSSFKFLSEKDDGIADAWNKGLKLSSGEIIGMLNSDDWFDPGSIKTAVSCLNIDNLELSYGICKRVNENKEVIHIMNKKFNPLRIYLNFGFSFTTCFMTKKTVEKIGQFSSKYRIAIDTDFLLRCYNKGVLFKKCDNITYMRLGGVSTKFKKEALSEHQRALRSNEFNPLLIFLFGLLKKLILIIR